MITVWSATSFDRDRRPHVAGLTISVQQYDCRPLPSDANVERGAVRLDSLRVKACWIGLDLFDGAFVFHARNMRHQAPQPSPSAGESFLIPQHQLADHESA